MGRRKKKKLKGPRVYHKLHGWKLDKEYSIEEIETLAGNDYFTDSETNRRISLRRPNYYTRIGYECANEGCDTTGSKYILGIGKSGDLHLDLYGIDKDGDLHMITIDHIKPKSKGGRNHVKNFQPMCKVCNEIKSDTWEEECSCDNGIIDCPGCKDSGEPYLQKSKLNCAGCKGTGKRTCGKCGGKNVT